MQRHCIEAAVSVTRDRMLRRFALIAASWLFILPPLKPTRVPPGHPPYLGDWRILRSFDDADACQKFAASVKRHTPEMKARRALVRALCISSDDPRLRPDPPAHDSDDPQ